jgi:AcrR family transcriptional regulator
MYHPGIDPSHSKPEPAPPPRSLVAQHPSVEPLLGASTDAQRARILEAITAVVAERGYVAATVSDIVRRARVSRTTFYDLYDGKEECFADACRYGFAVLEQRMLAAAAQARGEGWAAEMRASIRAYLTTFADEPLFARAYLVEVHAGGDVMMVLRDQMHRRVAAGFLAAMERAKAEREGLVDPPEAAIVTLAAGAEQLAGAYVRGGRASELAELESIFMYNAESLVLGPAR